MINQSDVSIIIPYWGRNKEERYAFSQCLPSLLETCECPIVVVLNGGLVSKDEIPNRDRVSVVEVPEQGQCKAVNVGVSVTSTPWIMVTNDDMIYSPGWFRYLTASEKPCVSARLVEPRPGAPTFEVMFCGGAGGDFDKKRFLDYVAMKDNSLEPDIRMGFNLPFLMKRDLWNLIGGYDEKFDPFGSNGDSDLEYKVKLAGVQSVQALHARVYHFSQTSGTFHPDNRAYWDKNWHYFIEKWGFERASSPTIWNATFEIPKDKLRFKPDWEGKYDAG